MRNVRQLQGFSCERSVTRDCSEGDEELGSKRSSRNRAPTSTRQAARKMANLADKPRLQLQTTRLLADAAAHFENINKENFQLIVARLTA
jgi:hemolysin D